MTKHVIKSLVGKYIYLKKIDRTHLSSMLAATELIQYIERMTAWNKPHARMDKTCEEPWTWGNGSAFSDHFSSVPNISAAFFAKAKHSQRLHRIHAAGKQIPNFFLLISCPLCLFFFFLEQMRLTINHRFLWARRSAVITGCSCQREILHADHDF